MPLKTKLVLTAAALTFVLALVLSLQFIGELLRQRIQETASFNDVLAQEVLLMTRQGVETGLRENPPIDNSSAALNQAVTDALVNSQALNDVMTAIVRYSPTVQDVSVTDARGKVLVSTDPDAVGQSLGWRNSFDDLRYGSIAKQTRIVFGAPQVLDTRQALDRNGAPFLTVHVGVRSSFLSNSYAPWLKAALLFALGATLAAVIVSALLANLALRPLEEINRRLETLTAGDADVDAATTKSPAARDTVVRVARTIDRLGEQMRTREAGYTALQSNLNQMLDTLRDGVLLFSAGRRAVMVSDAVAYFLNRPREELVDKKIEQIFDSESTLGAAVLDAFSSGEEILSEILTLEDGRQIQFSLDRINDRLGGRGNMGTLLTLRDLESAIQLEQELEVARRLAEIGSLTAGVGHEVKNPINAMVVHLELLRSKLSAGNSDASSGALRHVDILTGEMQRLDRVVQALADFSRPMELKLREHDLRKVIHAVIELTAAEMHEYGVRVAVDLPPDAVLVRVDSELIRQALLNLLLNARQAMPEGGNIRVTLRREQPFAVLEISDEGVGIPAEVLPRIFELYFTTKLKGSGIGLAMTYRILQLHGGALEVRSNTNLKAADHGTAFTLRLPVAVVAIETRKVVAPAVKEMGERA
ncbi:MAG: ATP-binding protein [Acidobacteriaceae bacterium]|nr:ATP-binding protein [Acidobacteriaceae bacterium]